MNKDLKLLIIKKSIRYLIFFPIIIYVGLTIFLFTMQKGLVYYPGETDFKICGNFTPEEQKIYNNTRFYEKKGENSDVIVFFHGNAGRACDRAYIKSILEKTNNSIIFVEYFGYSDSENSPHKKAILKDVENIGEYIKNSDYNNIYIMGRSVGTGPASFYAQNFKTDKLLLISPYSSLYKIGQDTYPILPIKYMFTENYSPEEYLIDYNNELFIIHGKEDNVIPMKFGEELYDGLKNSNKKILILENIGHNDIFDYEGLDIEIVKYFK